MSDALGASLLCLFRVYSCRTKNEARPLQPRGIGNGRVPSGWGTGEISAWALVGICLHMPSPKRSEVSTMDIQWWTPPDFSRSVLEVFLVDVILGFVPVDRNVTDGPPELRGEFHQRHDHSLSLEVRCPPEDGLEGLFDVVCFHACL